MSPLKLYENVVIGNFLYGLGASIQAKSEDSVIGTSVNLLQQTPADTLLADVLLESQGVVRVIEFKRRANKDKKEPEKQGILLTAIRDQPELKKISRSIHWFIETDPSNNSFVSRIVPYLDAYSNEKSQYSLSTFIESTAEEAVKEKLPFSSHDVHLYLDFLMACAGSNQVGTGGVLLSVQKDGSITFGTLSSITELRLTLKEYQAFKQNREKRFEELLHQVQREQELQKEREKQKEHEKQSRDIGRGYSL